MGKRYKNLDDRLIDFIHRQHVFFVGTAPSSTAGHLNISPKGLDTFRVFGPTTVAYLDLTGSGIETVAHVRENGRMTIMFCALEGPPLILRLYGRGRVVEPGDDRWEELLAGFPRQAGGALGDRPGDRSNHRFVRVCRARLRVPSREDSTHELCPAQGTGGPRKIQGGKKSQEH